MDEFVNGTADVRRRLVLAECPISWEIYESGGDPKPVGVVVWGRQTLKIDDLHASRAISSVPLQSKTRVPKLIDSSLRRTALLLRIPLEWVSLR